MYKSIEIYMKRAWAHMERAIWAIPKSLDLSLWIKWGAKKDLRATERSHLIRFAFDRITMGNSSGWNGG